MPALAQLEMARKKQGPHTSPTALSEAAQGLALAAAKAVVDGSCSGNPRSSQPPPCFCRASSLRQPCSGLSVQQRAAGCRAGLWEVKIAIKNCHQVCPVSVLRGSQGDLLRVSLTFTRPHSLNAVNSGSGGEENEEASTVLTECWFTVKGRRVFRGLPKGSLMEQ